MFYMFNGAKRFLHSIRNDVNSMDYLDISLDMCVFSLNIIPNSYFLPG